MIFNLSTIVLPIYYEGKKHYNNVKKTFEIKVVFKIKSYFVLSIKWNNVKYLSRNLSRYTIFF